MIYSRGHEDELVFCGRIVQDADRSGPSTEAERRFNRYIALVDALDGTEGEQGARALLRSIQAVHDHGAYETAFAKLVFGFPAEQVAGAAIAELPRLICTLPDWAGNFLCMLTQTEGRSQELVPAFNSTLRASDAGVYSQITQFIREQEAQGWLEHRRGVLGS